MSSIFEYQDQARQTTREAVGVSTCIFCGSRLDLHDLGDSFVRRSRDAPGYSGEHTLYTQRAKTCPICGWWLVTKEGSTTTLYHATEFNSQSLHGLAGCLKALDVASPAVGIDELRATLAAKYSDRFKIDPKRFEDVVASVYRDLGFQALVTNYRGDDGIDVILHDGSVMIGVQVKRYANTIDVGRIRELAGSLILGGMHRGIFVTTSDFQSGATGTVDRFRMKGVPIELINAKRFFEILCIAQRERPIVPDLEELKDKVRKAVFLEEETDFPGQRV